MTDGAYAKDDKNCCFCTLQEYGNPGTSYEMSAPRLDDYDFKCWVWVDNNGNICTTTDRDIKITYCGEGGMALSQSATAYNSVVLKHTPKLGMNYCCTVVRYSTSGYPTENGGTLLGTTTGRGQKSFTLSRAYNNTYYVKYFSYDENGTLIHSACQSSQAYCYSYTGADQQFTACTTGCYCAIIYGASMYYRGGCTTGILYLTKGNAYKIMVGGGCKANVRPAYGFGGCGYSGILYSGAGLSGIFCGSGAIAGNSSARALLIAGGAGGQGLCDVTNVAYSQGYGGGTSGGSSTGIPNLGGTQTDHGSQTSGPVGAQQFCGGATTSNYCGAGGGGWRGGRASYSCYYGGGGGSGYVNTSGLPSIVKSGITTAATGAAQYCNGCVYLYQIS